MNHNFNNSDHRHDRLRSAGDTVVAIGSSAVSFAILTVSVVAESGKRITSGFHHAMGDLEVVLRGPEDSFRTNSAQAHTADQQLLHPDTGLRTEAEVLEKVPDAVRTVLPGNS